MFKYNLQKLLIHQSEIKNLIDYLNFKIDEFKKYEIEYIQMIKLVNYLYDQFSNLENAINNELEK